MIQPLIAVTMGDPVGIGPEITVKALSDPAVHALCRPLVLGDSSVLHSAMALTGQHLHIREVSCASEAHFQPGTLNLIPLSSLPSSPAWGRPDRETGQAMVHYILRAIDMALAGEVAAIVTGPINKYAMNLSGYAYSGHTELLAERTGTRDYVMMLAGDRIRVSLVTIHTALRNVPDLITPEKIRTTLRVTHRALVERFAIPAPSIAVAGLNPHAGESGMFGDEEERILQPALEQARSEGIDAQGPFPPDTLFYHVDQGRFDAVVAMYHDQGLIPFKMRHFEDGVNTTLGLPIIRTSVDHGTAYDLAGRGRADHRSLLAAIHMAAIHARNTMAVPL
ncbi:4-hydroxythreonine-4-phosphate dehydrogenase PdxA [Desulfobotulus sp. H1]|uniref:4-hydroxythreonine-4-phosphate dehydrogenase n=1 Tax=Desulfobotulus pelophilus TaxID=2823377 RepID=A0ABT3N651_9BACT|nr:4-hydroxythreonine-4-phosphate dehydrogenase PdxA [Desulfobotulus pelophilus]MCW7752929.1 4-hydroxythreonine-4-phosphate dehydrogenase PdxA [Desulfobotulus pelophilus]